MAARVRYLDRDECRRLVNASPEPLRIADFHPDSGTLLVCTSKNGKVRHIELTEEGLEFFTAAAAGRPTNELLFHCNGAAWGKSHQQCPLTEACRVAQISPAASFHMLRHTYASLMVMDGVLLMVVARNLGHADTRMVESITAIWRRATSAKRSAPPSPSALTKTEKSFRSPDEAQAD